MNGGREPTFEHDFLRSAEKLAGLDIGWRQAVEDRLQRMEREKGKDSYRELGLRRMVREAEEEALDLGGWPLLAALLSYSDLPDGEDAHEFRMLMQQMAAYGVLVAGLARRARDLLA